MQGFCAILQINQSICLMLINFFHHNRPCAAYAVPEPSATDSIMRVYIFDMNGELGYEVIFFKKHENYWDTTAALKTNYPATYNDLCKKLSEALPGRNFTNEHSSKTKITERRFV